MSLSSSMITS
jgi:hypothetical protein